MSFTIQILEERAIATFRDSVEENEIKNAFIKIIESESIEKMNFLIFDYTDVVSYTAPKKYIDTLKMVTHFSSTWNKNIKVLTVATHPNIRAVATEIIKHSKELNWEYLLFEDLNTALDYCK